MIRHPQRPRRDHPRRMRSVDDAQCAKDRETERGATAPIRHMRATARNNHGPDQTAKISATRMRDIDPMRENRWNRA
jgi:hypothetical protein